MAQRVASPKSTGGGGFVFENQVAAYYLACLLAGRPPLDYDAGLISRIDFQTRVDGWLLDDLLLTLTSQGQDRRVALSIKSNQRFTASGAPTSEFPTAAWEQLLGVVEPKPFDPGRDLLGLVTTPLPEPLATKLPALLAKARVQDPADLARRLPTPYWVSEEERDLFAGFACPEELARRHGVGPERTGELLQRLVVLDFDFDRRPSRDERAALDLCRQALASGEAEEAGRLWDRLLALAAELRPQAGRIDLPGLVARLRAAFRLKHYPHYQPDWDRLQRHSQRGREAVVERVGGQVHLDRAPARAELDQAWAGRRGLILVGPPGQGKTALVKQWAEERVAQDQIVLWWSVGDYRAGGLADLERTLGLVFPLEELFPAVPGPAAWLILDGLDRCFDQGSFQTAAALLRAARMDQPESAWRAVITARQEEWERVEVALGQAGGPDLPKGWANLTIDPPELAELEPVWAAFPTLARLKDNPRLGPMVTNLKYLDLLARNCRRASFDPGRWAGESDVIDWIWQAEINAQGAARAGFLRALAERQGDRLEAETPADFRPPADQASADDLIRDGIIRRVEERYSFSHDLWGDWARLRVLLAHAHELAGFLADRLASPPWQRALRLYGQRLLERAADLKEWRAAMAAFAPEESQPSLAQDLLLEAAIFTPEPGPILDRLWPDLTANRGVWLRRFLGRFLHVASQPDPRVRWLSGSLEPDQVLYLAAHQRVPIPSLWGPVVRLLHAHLDEAISLAPGMVAELAEIGLGFFPQGHPLREALADLAVGLGEDRLAWKMAEGMRLPDRESDEKIFKAALLATPDRPERVTDLALVAAGRREPTGRIEQRIEGHNRQVEELRGANRVSHNHQVTTRLARVHIPADQPVPWPDGPTRRVDEAFRDICLTRDGLSALWALIQARPAVTREVILALLIESPRRRHRHGERLLEREELGLDYHHWSSPPFYLRGPFWIFLLHHPEAGLDLIIRLVDFATARWAENARREGQTSPEITIPWAEGEQAYLGDGRVLFWHRDMPPVPDVLASALMALEKWLYDRIDEAKDINVVAPILTRLAQGTRSLAFIGLLLTLGKRHPELFIGQLRPLLTVLEFYEWDLTHHVSNENIQYQMMSWSFQQPAEIEQAREWHGLSHRGIQLVDIMSSLCISIPQQGQFFEQVRAALAERLAKLAAEDAPARLRHQAMSQTLAAAQRLKEGRPLSSEELDRWWDRLQVVDQRPEGDAEYFRPADELAGGLAVLIALHRAWLRQEPRRKAWCLERMVTILRHPPRRPRFDLPETKTDLAWDGFLARVVPLLWAEEPDSPLWRECAFRLLTGHHYDAVARLFAAAFRVRDRLGPAWVELRRQAIRWAAVRGKIRDVQLKAETVARVDAWLQKEMKAFCVPETKPRRTEPLSWAEEVKAVKGDLATILQDEDLPPYRLQIDLDQSLIQAALDWLPPLAQARDERERKEWLNLHRELLEMVLHDFQD